MRPAAVLALLAALSAPAAAADGPAVISLAVGEERTRLGIMPRCDDLSVVAITADGRGVRGLRAGETLCSFDTSGGGGARQVWRIVVVAKGPPKDDAGPGGERAAPGPREGAAD
jgi:hypothetical protein